MLYLDYSRKAGEWIPNRHGGRENLEAIDFLRRTNDLVHQLYPGVVTIAEESTSFPMVSRPTKDGGLGFDYKWNMGLMHDTLLYFQKDPVHRKWSHDKLTFGMVYQYSEKFIMVYSHDEVVHLKGSMLAKMGAGTLADKAANLRALYGFVWTYPGKKLLFMGCEFAQPGEWQADGQLPWALLDDPRHAGVQRLVRDLNRLYRHHTPLHQRDVSPQGFAWIAHDDADQSVFSWLRFDADGRPVAVVCNLTPVPRPGYRVGVPLAGRWQQLLNTDDTVYGGSGQHSAVDATEGQAAHGHAQSLCLNLPPMACVVLAPA
jgi:1,4-alpha-glucan branching enzyme